MSAPVRVARLAEWRGKRALVTGASSGIGRLFAQRIARAGARVALVARREAELRALAAEIEAAGGEAAVVPADVGNREQALRCAERACAALGGVDVLVNNAGYGHHRAFLDWDLDDMERVMRVNYLGALYLTKALLPAMVERGRGWLVFVASVAGRIAAPDESAYVASKFALAGLAASLSLEVEDAGVHVLTVYPAVIHTPFFDAEALARMPAVSRRQMVEPAGLVDAMLGALARGQRELTHPRWIAPSYAVQALFPRFMHWAVRRSTRAAPGAARGSQPGDGGRS